MAKVDIDELRTVLGVEHLYPDELLTQVAEIADDVVDGLLNYNRSFIWGYERDSNNVVTFYTNNELFINVGDGVTISGIGGTYNGAKTVTEVGYKYFRATITGSQHVIKMLKPYGQVILTSQIDLYDNTPAVREAALNIAVEVFQQRVAPGGTIQAVDFTPTPHRLGRSLMTRVTGLLQPYMDMGRFVG